MVPVCSCAFGSLWAAACFYGVSNFHYLSNRIPSAQWEWATQHIEMIQLVLSRAVVSYGRSGYKQNMQYETKGWHSKRERFDWQRRIALSLFFGIMNHLLQLSRSSTQSSWKRQSPHQKIWAAARAHKQKMPVEAVPGHNSLIFSDLMQDFKHIFSLRTFSKTSSILEG